MYVRHDTQRVSHLTGSRTCFRHEALWKRRVGNNERDVGHEGVPSVWWICYPCDTVMGHGFKSKFIWRIR